MPVGKARRRYIMLTPYINNPEHALVSLFIILASDLESIASIW
jgi:hypothetical protein